MTVSAKPGRSMTWRLILWLTGAATAFWLVAAGLGVSVMEDEFGEIFDSSLEETTQRLLPLVVDDLRQRLASAAPHDLQPQTKSGEYLIYQVRDESGAVIIRSHDAPSEPFAAPLKDGFWADENYQFFTASADDPRIFVQVADAMANRVEALTEGALALFLPVLILIPLSVWLIWYLVRRTLAPVNDLRQAIEEKDGGNLAPVKAAKLPRELEPIARSVNNLLVRLQAAFDAEREFTANSAHELRTPIAGALAQTQRLVAELSGPRQRRAQQIEASLVALRHTTEKLLQLARAEAGIGAGSNEVDLARVLELVVMDFQRSAGGGDRLRFSRSPDASLKGAYSEDAFAIVLRNLIENALIHGRTEEFVDVILEDDRVVRIVNGADRLTPSELSAVRTRFGRGNTTAPGSGLGLSIAERLLQQMGARFETLSPARGREDGFEVVMTFRD